MKKVLITITMFFGLYTAAQATTLDFNSAVDCTSPDPGVTLTLVTGSTCQPWINPGPDSPGLGVHGSGVEIMRADFSVPVNFVSVDLGDFGGVDSDLLFLEIFDIGDASLDSVQFLLNAGVSTMTTFSLSSLTNIAYATFGNLQDQGFVAVDNLTFTGSVSIPAVPIPAAFWLFGTALIGFVGISRKRKVG